MKLISCSWDFKYQCFVTHLTMTEVFLVRSPNHMVEGLMLIMFRGMPSGAVEPHGNLFALKNSSSCEKATIVTTIRDVHEGVIMQRLSVPWGAYKRESVLHGRWSRDTEFQAFF